MLLFNPAGIGTEPLFYNVLDNATKLHKGQMFCIFLCRVIPLAWSIAFLAASRQYERTMMVLSH
jgi:hypothetical protein